MGILDKVMNKFTQNNATLKKTCGAIILAAGASSRMELADSNSKQFLMINGDPMIALTLLAFEKAAAIDEIVVVARCEDFAAISDIAREYNISKLKNIVAGGETRFDSSLHGVLEFSDRCEYLAVHDGARPFVSQRIINDTVASAKKYGAAVPGIIPHDTIKEVGADGFVLKTHDRSRLRQIQTPQTFEAKLLLSALLKTRGKKFIITDDALAVEMLGKRVAVIEGDAQNIKVTTMNDIRLAESSFQKSKHFEGDEL